MTDSPEESAEEVPSTESSVVEGIHGGPVFLQKKRSAPQEREAQEKRVHRLRQQVREKPKLRFRQRPGETEAPAQ